MFLSRLYLLCVHDHAFFATVASSLLFTCRHRLRRQQHSRLWLPLGSSSPAQAPTPTPTPQENDGAGTESDEAATGSDAEDAAVGSGGRLAGGTFESGTVKKARPVFGRGAGDETSERKNFDESRYGSGSRRSRGSGVKSSGQGRLRLKWGLDVDVPVRTLFV